MPAKTAIAAELHHLHHTPLQRSALDNIAFSSDQKTRDIRFLINRLLHHTSLQRWASNDMALRQIRKLATHFY
jgi:hypothetical protein